MIGREYTRLEAWCLSCRRHAAVPIAALMARYRVTPATRLDEIEARMTCEPCGGRDVQLTGDELSRPSAYAEGHHQQVTDDEAAARGLTSPRFI